MQKQKKTQRYADVDHIVKRIHAETPEPGDYLYDYRVEALKQELSKEDPNTISRKLRLFFRDLPISDNLKKGLKQRGFEKLTEIQRCVIPHALAGRDIMAASKTGSGKTLAYLVTLMENLYREKWTNLDGVGGIVLVPTRELAVQVFEVVRSISDFSELSFGLLIGGKSLEAEQQLISGMSILICTPGRLLQHLQDTVAFEASNCKMLVLDEADEIILMGFLNQVTQILRYLPKARQTLLLSATLTNKVLELSKLALRNPEKVLLNGLKLANRELKEGVSLADLYETPKQLKQFFMLMDYDEKVDNLFSFLKSHQKNKVLVFLTSCKQVRFIYTAFKKLKPGLPVLELHGRQKQAKRMAIYFTYSERKFCVLFTTALAARGLDFPSVDWVVQLDCPENVEAYVHKIGRTARNNAKGKSMLFLTLAEQKFIPKLNKAGILLNRLKVNPERLLTIKKSLQSLCSQDQELKYLGQRAVISYLNSIHYMSDKEVFDLKNINLQKYAGSYGLVQIPEISFESPDQESGEEEAGEQASDSDSQEEQAAEPTAPKTKQQRKLDKLKKKLGEKKSQERQEPAGAPDATLTVSKNALHNARRFKQEVKRATNNESDSDSDDEILLTKRKDDQIKVEDLKFDPFRISNKQLKKLPKDGHFQGRNIFVFQEEGKEPMSQFEIDRLQRTEAANQQASNSTDYVQQYASKLDEHEETDRLAQQEKLRVKKQKRKEREKEQEQTKSGAHKEQ